MPVSQFTCEDCGKSFTRQSNLHRHRRTTHHVDTISCSTCGRRFNRRDNYLRHTRNHIRIPDQESRPIVGSELLSDSQIQESIQKENVCPNFQNQVGSGVPLNDPQGCQSGVYGHYCAIPCPSNCKDSKCHIEDGICSVCEPGWSGISCIKKCREGWYGVNCSQPCAGHCRDGTSCNHVTGRCDGGCAEGRTGFLCDKECDDGTYGYNCLNRCSGHCLKYSSCNKRTGNCDVGCEAGFSNDDCSKECPSGYFGMNCKERCKGHCINNEPCDHVSGVCPRGCQDGYIGTYCNDSCREGYYGKNCSHVCPFTCQTCRNTDGLCTCKPGWMGPNCTTECIYSYGTNCVFPCSEHCINQTCDRFDGRCLVGCTEGKTCDPASQQNVGTDKDDIACTPWIISFSIVLVTSITLIIATIKLWRSSLKRSSNAGFIQSSKIPASVETQVGLSDGVSHYQELSVSKEHNTYQTLTL